MPVQIADDVSVAYVQKHKLHTRIGDILDEVLRDRPDDPMLMFASLASQQYLRRKDVEEEMADLRIQNAMLQKQILYMHRRVSMDHAVEITQLRDEVRGLRFALKEKEAHMQATTATTQFTDVLCEECKQKTSGLKPVGSNVSSIPSLRFAGIPVVESPQPTAAGVNQMSYQMLAPVESIVAQTPHRTFSGMSHYLTPHHGAGGHMFGHHIPDVEVEVLSTKAPRSTRFGSGSFRRPSVVQMRSKSITILHFNDVYNTSALKPGVGGAARFSTLLKDFSTPAIAPLVLFSGDCFSPSVMSTIMKGAHMVPVMKQLGVKCSVVGNHDLDFGLDRFEELSKDCGFPWVLSNVILKDTGLPIPGTKEFEIITWNGVCIGLIGIVEPEYIGTVSYLSNVAEYTDMVTTSQQLISVLKAKGVQVIIALTHMRSPNDSLLAKHVPGIDLILGGHDHEVMHLVTNDTHIVKSGTDFCNMSAVQITVPGLRVVEGYNEAVPIEVQVESYDVTPDVEEDVRMLATLDTVSSEVEGRLTEVVCYSDVKLDVLTETVRRKEAVVANWITSTCLKSLSFIGCDVVLLQGGCMRANTVYSSGDITLKDLLSIVPIEDVVVVIEVTPADLWLALDSGVARYPMLEGRFPHVAGASYAFDCRRPRGSRVTQLSIDGVNVQRYDERRKIRLGTSLFLANGGDGFDVFRKCKKVVDSEQGLILPSILRTALSRTDRLFAKLEHRIVIENEPKCEAEIQDLLKA
eukprot:PhM_4_TR14338/c0_g1_i1/m.107143/K01081/E3.1.3.5; 5'-nucleotidase